MSTLEGRADDALRKIGVHLDASKDGALVSRSPITGEEIGTLQRLIARVPSLLDDGADARALNVVLANSATTRMRGLGLRV